MRIQFTIRSVVFFLAISVAASSCNTDHEDKTEKNAVQHSLDEHIEAIKSNSKAFLEGDRDCESFSGDGFIDHIIKNKLEENSHKKYLTHRPWLTPIKPRVCNDQVMLFLDTLKNGDVYRIEVFTEIFDSEAHEIEYDPNNIITKIDQLVPIGTNTLKSELPNNFFKAIKVYKNGVLFDIPKNAYQRFYNIKTCTFSLPQTIIESYVDENLDILYLYFFNGKLGDANFTKMVFEGNKHICNIGINYYDLKCYQKFKQNPTWF